MAQSKGSGEKIYEKVSCVLGKILKWEEMKSPSKIRLFAEMCNSLTIINFYFHFVFYLQPT